MERKTEREQTFCLIFEQALRQDAATDILNDAAEIRDFISTPYIEQTFLGVCEQCENIDSKISAHLTRWTIDRISKASLALLRLAVYEIIYNSEIPAGVAANEAVELAKVYCDEKDVAFINGVLGSVIRSQEETSCKPLA